MTRLAEALDGEPELQVMYRGLLAAEARHHALYVDLACRHFSEDRVAARLEELAEHEAEVLAAAPPQPRLHN